MHPQLLIASTLIDVTALAVLGWLVWHSQRARDGALETQRTTLEALRSDLAQLLADAERRAQALDESLGAREQSLRHLLSEIARGDRTMPTPGLGLRRTFERGLPLDRTPPSEAERESARLGRRGPGVSEERSAQRARAPEGPPEVIDPAEARLLRDLELRLGGVGGSR